jgi:hypothetical protein
MAEGAEFREEESNLRFQDQNLAGCQLPHPGSCPSLGPMATVNERVQGAG